MNMSYMMVCNNVRICSNTQLKLVFTSIFPCLSDGFFWFCFNFIQWREREKKSFIHEQNAFKSYRWKLCIINENAFCSFTFTYFDCIKLNDKHFPCTFDIESYFYFQWGFFFHIGSSANFLNKSPPLIFPSFVRA